MAKNGGRRPGSGRKSKAEELKLAEKLDELLGSDWEQAVFDKIRSEALKGSFQHAQLLVAYKYGKPQDKVDITSGGKSLPRKEIIFTRYK